MNIYLARMINKNINDIITQDFQTLIDNGVSEGKTIEYKQNLNLLQDNDKKEFLYDVSSFANASGGDLIFGIIEDRETGFPKELLGIEISNIDDEFRKIESLIRDGIAPRLAGIEIRAFNNENGKIILLIRIPKGWNAPHQVIFKGADKFYTRSTNGKYKLDVLELRNAFILSETLVERIKKFRQERVLKILANETSIILNPHAKIMLHLVPLSAFQNQERYDLTDISNGTIRLSSLGGVYREWRYNFEGLISYVTASIHKTADSYIQVFFNGVIETVNADILTPSQGKFFIPAVRVLNYEQKIIESVKEYLDFQQKMKLEVPILIFITLLGVNGYKMEAAGHHNFYNDDRKIDRDILQIPEVWINSYKESIEKKLKSGFDMISNASGLERSFNYDDTGNWNPHR